MTSADRSLTVRAELAADEQAWAPLRAMTQARIGLRRTGQALVTSDVLALRADHAAARDAVHADLDVPTLQRKIAEPTYALATLAHDRATYLQRPDLGRQLDAASAALLSRGPYDIGICIVDGLSAGASQRHAGALIAALHDHLPGMRMAPVAIVRHGRVAVGDQIGELLGAQVVVVLIGERPGLGSPHSLGAYITWSPRKGRVDAERECVSNIRTPHGMATQDAARHIAQVVLAARRRGATGVLPTSAPRPR